MADCIEIAREFADRLAMELSVPVYLYGEAQEREYRRDLSQIREGEYEALYSKVCITDNYYYYLIIDVYLFRSESKNGNLILVRDNIIFAFSFTDEHISYRSCGIHSIVGCIVCWCAKIPDCVQYQLTWYKGTSTSNSTQRSRTRKRQR